MNKPYIPDLSLKAKIRRRITRLATRKPLPAIKQRYVSFSFDDFPKSAASNGAQILEKFGKRGTYYACTGQMGQNNHFGELCSAEDIKKLAQNSHEIGCHTQNHIDCTVSSSIVVQMEVQQNLTSLSAMGINNPDAFAFPYGDVSFAAKKVLSERFATLRGVQPGINHKGDDANQLLATPLEGDLGNLQYAEAYFDKLEQKPGWLIFYTHDVREHHSKWGCSPELLRAVIHQADDRGYIIAPISQVYLAIQQQRLK